MGKTEPIRTLGRYELLKRIAKGGMGEIYLARARGTAGFEKTCIIKTILGHLAEEEEFVTKFLDEGRIVVQLVHGNIVPVFDMGEEDGEYFIAMEYIPGRDLREVTKRLATRGETMPVDLALFVASEVCKGLDYAHRKTDDSGNSLGIVHRDVSPSNVLISREGEVKIIDFGIARAAGRLGKTVSGRIQGKFCYMSPEQASGKALDGRSDIFSTGVVLYELLTGFRPFEGDSDLQSLDLVRRCEFDPPSTFNGEVPEEVDEIVSRALAKEPQGRYRTIDRLQIDMLQYLYTTGSSSTPNDLARFLADLFPDGLERDELRSARDSGPSPPKKMSLDDALDFELGRLEAAADANVDPHETTAISTASDDADLEPHETITRAERAGLGVDKTAEPAETPVVQTDHGSSDDSQESVREAAEEPHADRHQRGYGWVLALIAITVIAASVYAASRTSHGNVYVTSSPEGAQIIVDGAAISGAKTPHQLRLEPGSHDIRLELAGFEDRTVRVDVVEGERQEVGGSTTKLRAIEAPQGPRTFRVTASPDDATLTADGSVEFGTGTGANLVVKPGEVARVTASHPDCQSKMHQLTYGQTADHVHIELRCGVESADAGTQENAVDKERPSTEQPVRRQLRFQIRTEPKGATVRVNGEELGTSPVVWTGPREAVLEVDAQLPGYEPASVKRKATSVRGSLELELARLARGCLTMRIINPFVANVRVGTKDLGSVSKLDPYELPAGPHRIHVSNESAGLDHTRSVVVEAGTERCSHVVIDGSKL